MKTIIAGGRDFDDLPFLSEICDSFHDQITEVVSSGYRGADYQGELWAKSSGIPVKTFPADWNTLGRAAGPIRNKAMAEYADAVILFLGGRGTDSMRCLALKYGLTILYDGGNV